MAYPPPPQFTTLFRQAAASVPSVNGRFLKCSATNFGEEGWCLAYAAAAVALEEGAALLAPVLSVLEAGFASTDENLSFHLLEGFSESLVYQLRGKPGGVAVIRELEGYFGPDGREAWRTALEYIGVDEPTSNGA